jgi:hypothetical protein
VCLQDDADDEIGVPASPCIVRGISYKSVCQRSIGTARSTLHGSGHV